MLTTALIISFTALLASLLTFFSGFGLGTILTPVFAIFFPVEIAISLTAVVHLLNNLFKIFLVGITKEWSIVIRFGIPSVVASFIGALSLNSLAGIQTVYHYSIAAGKFETTPLKICIAVLIIVFTLAEIIPQIQKIQIGKKHLVFGGLLSGFFGGLSGNQGALRSMFLIKSGLSKESFIATGVFIACMVDLARLPVYSTKYFNTGLLENKWLLVAATASAFAGAWFGNKLFKKITFSFLHFFVSVGLILIGLLIGGGIV